MVKVPGKKTKRDRVSAPRSRRKQRRILDLFGKLEWDPKYDHKKERERG